MDYRPAELTGEQIARLQRMEEEMRADTQQDIILIAYDPDNDPSASEK
ncbi:hypothetical protein J31TS4_18590 [Paenibacillus sp. J31TS4]|nr:hypothetical protein [Paenibacillus sp. J31TS4]GIP38579.1 hypothetical protein J31TS4_18590 [Paenibacillus sp. J31TS4]